MRAISLWRGQSRVPHILAVLMSPLPSLAPLEPALTLIQLDTKCSCDLPQSLTVAVTSFLTPAPWRVKWRTVHVKLVASQQSAGLRPGLPGVGVSLSARCLAGSLGKSEHVDTIHLFVGSDSLLCPLAFSAQSPSLSWGPLKGS